MNKKEAFDKLKLLNGVDIRSLAEEYEVTINKDNKTIKLLLDRSGSMSSDGMLKALISGANSLILEQRQSAKDLNEDINIEIYDFLGRLTQSNTISRNSQNLKTSLSLA